MNNSTYGKTHITLEQAKKQQGKSNLSKLLTEQEKEKKKNDKNS
jgi:hypothetical protein